MITEVIMPKLGQTMEEGTIVEWIKHEGDAVSRGDILFTAESDKAVLEVESSAKGFLRKILVPAGVKVPVLTVVALMTRTADEPLEEPEGIAAPGPGAAAPAPAPESAMPPLVAAPPAAGRLFASPRARRAAREQGVDLAQVTGSGPSGRIVERDVLSFLAAQPAGLPAARAAKATPLAAKTAAALGVDLAAVGGTGVAGRIMKADVETAALPRPAEPIPAAVPAPAPAVEMAAAVVETVPVAGLRRIIAERMAASHHTTARVTLVTEADATAFVEAREQLKASVEAEWGFAPGFNDLLALMVARALREFPYMNARLSPDGEAIERLPFVNLGVAVDTDRGLLVPVIRNTDQKGLRALGAELRALVERARAGKSLPDDLSGGTFTITNLGMYDVDAFTPIINLPEAAILGVGRIQPQPVVRDGQVVVRQMWVLSLAFDHRLVDGAPAARFLQRIKQLIESPMLLLA
jgi:pyruvate dehydrogenase E2 component (dihydrolipoamide acetyltransferase)